LTRIPWAGLAVLLGWLAAAAAAEPAGPVTTDTLGTFLGSAGYEPEVVPSTTGGVWGYDVAVTVRGRVFNLEVQVSPDGHTVWVIAPLRIVPDPPKLPAHRLLRLLEENDRIGPASFAYVNRRVHLNLPMANRGLTPEGFRRDVEALCDTIVRTEPLWDPARWTEDASTARDPARRGIR
jgi:hypothetical protein